MNAIIAMAAAAGNEIAMAANIKTSEPRATASHLDLEEDGTKIAVMIVSMPTKKKTMARKIINHKNANPAKASTNPESIIERTPSPI
jgi:ATP adenylyltransferase/5',5'''-P-1,P-4-tetraphosphate phosphorylase II